MSVAISNLLATLVLEIRLVDARSYESKIICVDNVLKKDALSESRSHQTLCFELVFDVQYIVGNKKK